MQNRIWCCDGPVAWWDGRELTCKGHDFSRPSHLGRTIKVIQLHQFDHVIIITQLCDAIVFFAFSVYTASQVQRGQLKNKQKFEVTCLTVSIFLFIKAHCTVKCFCHFVHTLDKWMFCVDDGHVGEEIRRRCWSQGTASPCSDRFSPAVLNHFPSSTVIWLTVRGTGSVGSAQHVVLTLAVGQPLLEWNMILPCLTPIPDFILLLFNDPCVAPLNLLYYQLSKKNWQKQNTRLFSFVALWAY